MDKLFSSIMNALKNPKVQKFILIALAVIIGLVLLSNASEKVARFLKGLKLPSGDNVFNTPSEQRQLYIEEVMNGINEYLDESLWEWFWSTDEEGLGWIEKAFYLPDNELYYGATYYKKTFSIALFKDLDEETFPLYEGEVDNLKARLEKMNLIN